MLMVGIVLVSVFLYFLYIKKWGRGWRVSKKKETETASALTFVLRTQLQAYERLILFVERSDLMKLTGQLFQETMTVSELRLLLAAQIEQELEHNLSQQIYVSKRVWQALLDYKDQNIMLLNFMADKALQEQTSVKDWVCCVIEIFSEDKQRRRYGLVKDALDFEAKQLISGMYRG